MGNGDDNKPTPVYTYWMRVPGVPFPVCGDGGEIQPQIQSSLNTEITLLKETPEGEPGHDEHLSDIVTKINNQFETLALDALKKRRKALIDDGHEDYAERLEVTVLFTDRGLQLAFVQAAA